MLCACRKIATRHPDVKVLNCALSMPYTGVRTYYSRIYEGRPVLLEQMAGQVVSENKGSRISTG